MHQTAPQRSQYRILGLVGQGQFGRVFCAVDRRTGSLAALKELDRQRFPTHKFLRELRFLLSLQHRNIVTCQALEHTSTGRYLVMEYCEGGTLRDLIQVGHQPSLAQSLKLVIDVLAGLEHAHSRGVIHCDLKPENILLSLEATGWVARISDFGVARLSQELRQDGLGDTGSPAYMAPERFYGQFSSASDLYAVGVLLFELVVGQRPFLGLPGQIMSAHLNQSIKVPDTVPFLLRSTITTALQKLPARRFTSAAEMLRSIQLAAEVEETLAQDVTFPLSKPVVTSTTSLDSTQLQTLHAPVTSLAVDHQHVYQGSASQVCCLSYTSDDFTGEALHQWQMQLAEPVRAITLRPQEYFVLTQSRQHDSLICSVYCLPKTQTLSTFSNNQSEYVLDHYQLLSLKCTGLATAIDPQGQWIAIAKAAIESGPAGNQTTLRILKLPGLQPVKLPVSCQFPTYLVALNSRYGIAIFNQQINQAQKTGTILSVFTRRGSFIGILPLPIPLHLVTPSATFQYRLIAVEQDNLTSALLINLKPFKISRIGLEIAPVLITTTGWGYILADRHGKIVLLNHSGQRISAFEGPASPTAIATFKDYGLLIASWSGSQGTLHRIDLRQLNLDLFL